MKRTEDEDIPYFSEIDPLVRSLGLRIVELLVSRSRGSVQARLVITSAGGVGVQECSKAHRLAQPRLEALLGTEDLGFEVASPGLDRTFKDAREFAVFEGRGCRVMLEGTSDWIAGKIARADESALDLVSGGGARRIPYAGVAKAKLDFTQEEG